MVSVNARARAGFGRRPALRVGAAGGPQGGAVRQSQPLARAQNTAAAWTPWAIRPDSTRAGSVRAGTSRTRRSSAASGSGSATRRAPRATQRCP